MALSSHITRTASRPTRFFPAVSCALLVALSPAVLFRANSSLGLYFHLCSDSGVHFDSVSRIGDRTELSHNHDCRECDPCETELLDAGSTRTCDHGGGLAIFGGDDDWSAHWSALRSARGCSEDSPTPDEPDSHSPIRWTEFDSLARSTFALHRPAHPQAVAVCLPLLSCVQFLI